MKAQYSTVNQEQQRGGELDKQVKNEVAMAGDRGQSVQEVRDLVDKAFPAKRSSHDGSVGKPFVSSGRSINFAAEDEKATQ